MVKNKRLDINFNQKLISGFLFMKNTMCTLSDAYVFIRLSTLISLRLFRLMNRRKVSDIFRDGLPSFVYCR